MRQHYFNLTLVALYLPSHAPQTNAWDSCDTVTFREGAQHSLENWSPIDPWDPFLTSPRERSFMVLSYAVYASVTTHHTCYGSLACLVLRRSYVSNSAFPAADWVRKWFCSHRNGNARFLRPPCLRCTKSHAENPEAKARSTYWRRAFAVPSTCVHRATGHVSVRRCVCLYLSGTALVRWRHHSRASHVRTYPPCPEYIYSELITGIHEKVIFNLTKHSENISANTAWYPRRLGCSGCIWWQRNIAETTLSWPWLLGKDNGFKKKEGCDSVGCVLSAEADGPTASLRAFLAPLPFVWVQSPRWADDNAWDYIFKNNKLMALSTRQMSVSCADVEFILCPPKARSLCLQRACKVRDTHVRCRASMRRLRPLRHTYVGGTRHTRWRYGCRVSGSH